MKRFLKWFFGILIFLIILLVIAAITLPYYFDPNKYKSDIIAQIKPYMHGRDLKIPGKIKLSVFPWLGVEIGKTVVGNADGFVLKPFMTIEHARAHIRLLSLLGDTPEIGSLDFDGVVVNLQRDAEGRNNWSDLMEPTARAGLHKTALTTTGKPAAVIPKFKIDGIHFKNARINFQDNLHKNDITISKLNLDAGPINQFQPVPLRGNLDYSSKTQGLSAASAFATTLHITPDAKHLDLKQLAINTNLAGEVLNNKTMATALTVPDLKIDLSREKIDAETFQLSVDKMQSSGRLSLRKFSNPIIRFGLNMKTLDVDSLLPAPAKAAPVAPIPTTTGNTAVDNSPAIFAALLPLKTADIQGTINVSKLLFKHLQFDQTSVTVIARSGLISAQPQAKLYNGTYQGDVQINVSHLPVRLNLRQQLQHVSMGPITLALTGKESMTGTANIQGQFVSQGNTLEQITRQLNGDATFNIRDVQLTLMDVEQLVLQKWYDKLKLAQKQQPGKKVTAFDSMRGSIRVQNGIAYNHDFDAVSQRVHLTGSGQASLVDHTVDYTLVTIPQTSLAIQVSGTRYDLKGKHIPTTIRGPWANPEVKNGLQNVIKASLDTAIQKKKQQAVDKLKNKLKDKLQDKLKGLLQH